MEGLDLWQLFAGLGLFLYGTMRMEGAVKQLSGRPFKLFLRKQTNNVFKAVIGGAIVTAVLQSSSVVAFMVLAFVGAGVISFRNALAIILGANLGTTAVGWIVATVGFHLDIEAYALPVIAVTATGLFFFQRRRKLYHLLQLFFGFAILFMGLGLMKSGAEGAVSRFDLGLLSGYGAWAFILAGVIITTIIQSSSATVALALTAISAGVLTLHDAAAIVIGSEVGTTVKVLLGGIKGSADKRRVGYGNFYFNIVTLVFAYLFLTPLLALCTRLTGISDPLIGLVMFQSVINLLSIFLFLPFINVFSRWLERTIKPSLKANGSLLTHELMAEPEAAVDLLHAEGLSLLRHTTAYIHLAIDSQRSKEPHDIGGMLRTFVKTSGKSSEVYDQLKNTEGLLLDFYARLQGQEVSDESRQLLTQYIGAVRQSVQAAKEIKDIQHNLKAFRESGNDQLHNWYHSLQQNWIGFDEEFLRILDLPGTGRIFEALSGCMKDAYDEHERSHRLVLTALQDKKIGELEASTVMNVLRDVLSAKKALLRAAAYIRLDTAHAGDFEYVPR